MQKKVILTLTVFILISSMIFSSDHENDYRILVTGEFHGSDIDSIDSRDWLGLFRIGSAFVLKQVNVHDRICRDPIVDGSDDSTGVSITVDAEEKPNILIKTKNKLRTGLVTTYYSEKNQIAPGDYVPFSKYSLAATGEITDEGFRHPSDLLIQNYELKLFRHENDNPRQVLVHYDRLAYDGIPSLIWAGDLDGDRKPDLIMDITNHYNVTYYALFLSSEAEPGQMVKMVAELILRGC